MLINLRRLIDELRTIIRELNKNKSPHRENHRDNSQGTKHESDSFPLKTPLAPPQLDEEDYPNARFWTAQEWQKYVNDQMDYGNTLGKLGFICDEDGNPVLKERIKKMTEAAKKLWSDLYRHRYDPDTWRCVEMRADKYYINSMCIAFPELRLCADNWKAQSLATIRYPDWSNGLRSTGRLTRLQILTICFFGVHFFLLGQVPSINANTSGQSSKPRSGKKRPRDQDIATSKKPNKHPRLQQEIVDISSDSLRSPSPGPMSGSSVVPPLPTSVLQPVLQPAPAVATITPPGPVTAPIVMPVVSPKPTVATVTAPTQTVLSVETIAAPVGLVASVPTPIMLPITDPILPPITAHAVPIAPVVHPVAAPVVLPVALPTSLATPVVTTVSASVTLPDLQPVSSSADTTIEPDRMAARKRNVSFCA